MEHTVQQDVHEALGYLLEGLPHQSSMFKIQHGQITTCCICKTASHREETSTVLELSPVSKGKQTRPIRKTVVKMTTISDMMDLHCSGETIDGENCYQCDVCNLRTCATVERSIQLLANTLAIAIKRSGKTSVDVLDQDGTIKKISQRKLTLFAICCHMRSDMAGHCFTYVRTGPAEWFS